MNVSFKKNFKPQNHGVAKPLLLETLSVRMDTYCLLRPGEFKSALPEESLDFQPRSELQNGCGSQRNRATGALWSPDLMRVPSTWPCLKEDTASFKLHPNPTFHKTL